LWVARQVIGTENELVVRRHDCGWECVGSGSGEDETRVEEKRRDGRVRKVVVFCALRGCSQEGAAVAEQRTACSSRGRSCVAKEGGGQTSRRREDSSHSGLERRHSNLNIPLNQTCSSYGDKEIHTSCVQLHALLQSLVIVIVGFSTWTCTFCMSITREAGTFSVRDSLTTSLHLATAL
jgi:hypothetical protein